MPNPSKTQTQTNQCIFLYHKVLSKKAAYEYIPSEKPKEYNTRDKEGKVIIAPRKIYTNNSKKGNGSSRKGHLFS
jgi:hypothetical protein